MPSFEIFEAQTQKYKDSVIAPSVKNRVSIEAGSTFGWSRYTGSEGLNIGIDKFGSSAPGNVVLDKYGFSAEQIYKKVLVYLKK